MTLEQHDPVVQRATDAVTRSHGLRTRLLKELGDLERGLQTATKLVEALPEDEVPEPEGHKVWWPWKR